MKPNLKLRAHWESKSESESDWRIFLSGRPWQWFAAAWIISSVVTFIAWSQSLPLPFFAQLKPRNLPIWELMGLVLALLVPYSITGRMPHIDRIAQRDLRPRLALITVGAATLAVTLPTLLYAVLAVVPARFVVLGPQQMLRNDSFNFTVPSDIALATTSNLALILGCTLVAAAYARPAVAATIGLLVFVACAWATGVPALHQLVPLSGGLNGIHESHFLASLPVLAVGVALLVLRSR